MQMQCPRQAEFIELTDRGGLWGLFDAYPAAGHGARGEDVPRAWKSKALAVQEQASAMLLSRLTDDIGISSLGRC
jgi:hypothetical protein